MKFNIPDEVLDVAKKLKENGYQAYLVGGCVRDILLDKKPKDWDITTNAQPEEIQKLFPDSVYENQFGTVGVKTEAVDPTSKIIEITTFRLEGKYSDKRHPDNIVFAKTIEEDLARRDFTINALALNIRTSDVPNINVNKRTSDVQIIDSFGGQKDLKNKIIRTVGQPEARFNEDALRLMRAVRLATELNFQIEEKTQAAIKEKANLLSMIAQERIRDELEKIIISERAADGLRKLAELNLL